MVDYLDLMKNQFPMNHLYVDMKNFDLMSNENDCNNEQVPDHYVLNKQK
jgi:hypothetical protein